MTVRLRDGAGNNADTLDVLRTGTTTAVNLGSVDLGGDYMANNQSALFAATMTASTTTVAGVTATRITITVGAQTSGTTPRTVTASSTMSWTPSALATDLAGRPASTTPAVESGAADREF